MSKTDSSKTDMSNTSKTYTVNNLTDVAQMVDIILHDGRTSTIRLMPRARGVKLPAGAKVHVNWIGINPRCVSSHELKK